MFTRLSNTLHDVPTESWDTVNVSKMGPTIVVGPIQLKVRRQNSLVESEPPQANRARDEATQRVASSWHTRGPTKET
jgi:hypothetical protein